MRNDFQETVKNEVGAVKARRAPKPRTAFGATKKAPNQQTTQSTTSRCDRCGKSPGHARHNCPAKDAVCHKCSKKGHYGAVCRSSKTVGVVAEEDYAFLGEIGTDAGANPWCAEVTVNELPVCFKIDTGADVTVMPEGTYQTLQPTPRLEEPKNALFSAAYTILPVRGQFIGELKLGDKATQQEIFVVPGARQALLGRPAIESLNLVGRISAVGTDDTYRQQFPGLFKGLGKLDGPDYVIKLKPEAKPFALSTQQL